ncbi:hypothetical protein Drorol1_Dr00019392 [Drosera rotundifolia]
MYLIRTEILPEDEPAPASIHPQDISNIRNTTYFNKHRFSINSLRSYPASTNTDSHSKSSNPPASSPLSTSKETSDLLSYHSTLSSRTSTTSPKSIPVSSSLNSSTALSQS